MSDYTLDISEVAELDYDIEELDDSNDGDAVKEIK